MICLLSWVTRMVIRTIINPCVDLLFSLWHSSSDVVCFVICWSVSANYVNLILRACKIGMNMSDFGVWSGMMSFFVLMICSVVDVMWHSGIDNYNSCMWNLSIVSYSCSGGNYSYVVIWSNLYMNYDDFSCSVCGNVAVTWNDFACPHGSVWSLTWAWSWMDPHWQGVTIQGLITDIKQLWAQLVFGLVTIWDTLVAAKDVIGACHALLWFMSYDHSRGSQSATQLVKRPGCVLSCLCDWCT